MNKIYKIELKRAFRNNRFYVALMLGCIIVIIHLIDIIPEMLNSYTVQNAFPKTSFYVWIGAGLYKWETYLYFLIFPLIAVIPYKNDNCYSIYHVICNYILYSMG